MTTEGFPTIAETACIVLDKALQGGPSGLDADTITWCGSAAEELERTLIAIEDLDDFGPKFVSAMAASRREVSLMAVELTALALLPIEHPDRELVALFNQLVGAVSGPPLVVPSELLRGIGGPGFRPAGMGDALPARLQFLIKYVEISGTCPTYDGLIENGYDEYLGHEDLHSRCPGDLLIETPWACAEFSSLVDHDNTIMQFDLDHMLWPEFLAPPRIRLVADQLRVEHADLLQGDSGSSLIGVQKDLYLLKQLMGSWDELMDSSPQPV